MAFCLTNREDIRNFLGALGDFFSEESFMPHGHCFLWFPEVLWLHVFSDILIAASYYAIPLGLIYFIRRRRDMPFPKLFWLFGAFIVLCGTTHLMSIWVLWHPHYGPEGILKLITGIVSAITAVIVWRIMPAALTLPSPEDLRKLNEELQQTNARIEREVAARTAELQQANALLKESEGKLRQTAETAQNASQAKSDFLASMSHEIRTPMNAVIGLSRLLLRSQNLPPKERECVETLSVSADSLMGLLNDLLDLSKIESSRLELESIPFSIRAVAEEALRITRVKAEEKNITVSLNASGDLPDQLVGDPTRIRQIITNLLSNAVKYTDTGSVLLSIRSGEDEKNESGVALIIEVADTGIGIPEDRLEAIFDHFTQSRSSDTRQYGGSGLGLTISRNLARLMGGDIRVESAAGKGSVFTVTLSLEGATSADAAAAPRTRKTKGTGGKKPLLVVEDWQPNVMVIGMMLDMLGFTYEVARSGEEALEMAGKKEYALILLDIQLPGISGYEVALALRGKEAREKSRHIPIIATTAYAIKGDRERCLEAGMDEYLAKPLDVQTLGMVLRRFVG